MHPVCGGVCQGRMQGVSCPSCLCPSALYFIGEHPTCFPWKRGIYCSQDWKRTGKQMACHWLPFRLNYMLGWKFSSPCNCLITGRQDHGRSWKSRVETACSVTSDSLRPHGLQPARLFCPWDFPGKNTGGSCHFLVQGIFLTPGSNLYLLGLLHWQVDSLLLCHQSGRYQTQSWRLLMQLLTTVLGLNKWNIWTKLHLMGCRGNGYNLVLSQISQDLRSPGLPGGSVSKESACNAGDHPQCRRPGFDPWVGKIPWRRKWQPIPVFLPGKSHKQRSLVGCSPWGLKELETTERLNHVKSP